MVLRTVVQSRAATFAFDKAQEKQISMAAYQVVMTNPYAMRQPKLLYKALKTVLSDFGGKWKTLSDTDLVSPEEFAAQQQQIAMQAVQALFQQAKAHMDITGVPADPREVIKQAPDAITQAQAEAYNPALAPKEGP
jgi:hypothetical protein